MRAPGQVLAEKYRLVRELGKGGMGSVWCAEHLILHSQVALKLIESTDSDNPDDAVQFLREARLAAGLSSQHVVKIFDYGLAEDTPFIAMELLEGETLRRRLQRKGALPLAEAQQLLRQVARGVERAHRGGIVHRDLKPENVFIVCGEDAELAKVLDFGLAKAPASALVESISPATPTGAVLGTPHYMSPEQAMGSKGLDHHTDLWSLGVMAFECLTGQVPFRGDTLGALIVALCSLPVPVPSERAAVPAGFDAWFARACARDPAARFHSARELADHFDRLQAGTEDVVGAVAVERANTLHALTPAGTASGSDSAAAALAVAALAALGSATGKPTVRALEPSKRPRRLSGLGLVAAVVVVALVGAALVVRSQSTSREETARSLTPAPASAPAPTPPTIPPEAKSAEAKSAEAKPAEAKPAEAKPSDAKPSDGKATDATEAKPTERKRAEAKPAAPAPATQGPLADSQRKRTPAPQRTPFETTFGSREKPNKAKQPSPAEAIGF